MSAGGDVCSDAISSDEARSCGYSVSLIFNRYQSSDFNHSRSVTTLTRRSTGCLSKRPAFSHRPALYPSSLTENNKQQQPTNKTHVQFHHP